MYHPLQRSLPYLFEIVSLFFLSLSALSLFLPAPDFLLQQQRDRLHQIKRLQNRLSL